MPAGDIEKAKIAYQFGADACYGSTSAFSMRTREIGFNYKTLKEVIDYAHSIGKKFYVTLNTYPHEFELTKIKTHAKKLIDMNPDAIIVADAGILAIVKKLIDESPTSPRLRRAGRIRPEIHLSTQANTTNSESIKFWAKQGVSRIILARELSLKEIAKIRKSVPKKITIEAFVHGAMCNSVSGRCNLSNYLSFRDANRGACVQACRWKFALVEEKRPGQFIPVEEDDEGSYIYNSRDLCMIEHLKELADAGIGSFKIEGRNKSIYYAAIVARAYRKAIDIICHPERSEGSEDSSHSAQNDILRLRQELSTVTSRGYSTGFYFGRPTDADINYESSRPTSDWQFVGIVKEAKSYQLKANSYLIEARNEILPKTKLEIVTPTEIYITRPTKYVAPDGTIIEKPNPNTLFVLNIKKDLPVNSMIRAKLRK